MKKLLFLILFFISHTALAETTGNELYQQIIAGTTTDTLQAYGYISGVLDTEDLFLMADVFSDLKDVNRKFKMKHFCFGDDKVTLGQVTDIIKKYLTNHPEGRHQRANGLIRVALIEAFPCARNP